MTRDIYRMFWVATESCCQISQFGSHYLELPSHDSLLDSDYCPLSKASWGFVFETYEDYFLVFIGLLWNWQQDREVKVRWSKGLDMKWSLYMSSNQQNLTIGSIGLKSDYRVVKISLTTGLGSYPGLLTVSPTGSPSQTRSWHWPTKGGTANGWLNTRSYLSCIWKECRSRGFVFV